VADYYYFVVLAVAVVAIAVFMGVFSWLLGKRRVALGPPPITNRLEELLAGAGPGSTAFSACFLETPLVVDLSLSVRLRVHSSWFACCTAPRRQGCLTYLRSTACC
jgi:hypothetical protein